MIIHTQASFGRIIHGISLIKATKKTNNFKTIIGILPILYQELQIYVTVALYTFDINPI